jgi:hypothetical protein
LRPWVATDSVIALSSSGALSIRPAAANDPPILTGALVSDVSAGSNERYSNDHKRIRAHFSALLIIHDPGIVVANIFQRQIRPVARSSCLIFIA